MSSIEIHEPPETIAIVGMAGRFPGAASLDEFWRNLRDGVESINRLSDPELIASGADPAQLRDPAYVKAKGVLAEADLFDASFFGLSPGEAEITDPQHRVFLECAWEALEDAGYDPERYAGAIGVYAGSSINTYLAHNIRANPAAMDLVGGYQLFLGNDKDFLPTRVSYKLNLKGPSVSIQTACSTSLVAVYHACQSLLNYQCDMALAGGVSILFPQKLGYQYQEGMILSPDGHCRAFDADAKGTVAGEGVGIVVLKRLSEAMTDGDHIYAVIRGSAINNDGSLKVGYTAPSVEGQAEVVAMALAMAGVDAESISYVEAHGTGTPLGDPVEIAALTRAYRAYTQRRGFCAIGSVKSNIGHLDAAAGVTGLIKTALALSHQQLPPSLHYTAPNPKLELTDSPFVVNHTLCAWEASSGPRRAGVSSFGIGGTNAHVVLEEAPRVQTQPAARPAQLLVLSARSTAALDAATARLRDHLTVHPELDLADAAYTLQAGRRAFPHRRILVASESREAIEALDALPPARVYSHSAGAAQPPVVFMFTGQGAQYPGMGRDLYAGEAVFRAAVDRCADLLRPHLGFDLRSALYPTDDRTADAGEKLAETAVTQPALFVIEYALAQLWLSWGIRPTAMIGHSIGEWVAACLAGVFTLEDALRLVAVRGRLMQRLPAGNMLVVPLPEAELTPLLAAHGLTLAAVNGAALCVVSGPAEATARLQAELAQRSVECKQLRTSHAFHSPMMEPALAPFIQEVSQARRQEPAIPFISNVSGSWIRGDEATDPAYWARHLRQTVRFRDGLATLLSALTQPVLLEVGPGHTLAQLARQHPARSGAAAVLTSLRYPQETQDDAALLLTTLGRLWLYGAPVDWAALHTGERRRRVRLPTYPFERRRYWVEPDPAGQSRGAARSATGKKIEIGEWFYTPSWRREALPPTPATAQPDARRLVFKDRMGVGDQVIRQLQARGAQVTVVTPGRHFEQTGDHTYTINPQQPQDYAALVQALVARDQLPDRLLHLWLVTPAAKAASTLRWDDQTQAQGFYSLLYWVQAYDRLGGARPLQIQVVGTHLCDVTGDEVIDPAKATLLGICRVIPQEVGQIRCRVTDIPAVDRQSSRAALAGHLLAEADAETTEPVVAYRGAYRWVQDYAPLTLPELREPSPSFRPGGVYLITGGLGEIGYALARSLAQTVQAKLVFVGRSALPPQHEWAEWTAGHGPDDKNARRIHKLQALEQMGAEVLVLSADVADAGQMQAALRQIDRRFGRLDGVVHAAGTVAGAAIADLQAEACEAQFQAKGRGLVVLAQLLRGRPLDFCLVTSSLSTVLGGLGYAAYAAANSYMDAFIHAQQRAGQKGWVAVNWDAWQDATAAARPGKMGAELANLAMTPEEGVETFRRILAYAAAPQVIVSTSDLQPRLDQWVRFTVPPKAAPVTSMEAESSVRTNGQSYVAPRNPTEEGIAALWSELMGLGQVGAHDNFFELGGSSLVAVRMFAQIEQRFGQKLPLATLFDAPTVAELATQLDTPHTPSVEVGPEPMNGASLPASKPSRTAWSSLVPIQPKGSRPPLFCVHAAGGNVLIYRDLARYLGEDQPVYGLQAQGLDGQRPTLTSAEEMTELYLQEVKAIRPQGPYLVGGYCMGGTVALEMAQRLRAQGEEVALLALFETYNWRHMKIDSPWIVAYSLYQKINFHLRNFLLLDSAKKVTFFREKYKVLQARQEIWAGTIQAKLGRRPDGTNAEQMIPAQLWATNDQAALDYQPRPYPGKITHFRPRAEYAIHITPGLEWDGLAEGGVETHRMNVYPAGMLVEPFVGQLAVAVRDCITRGLAEVSGRMNEAGMHATPDDGAALAPASTEEIPEVERETLVF